MAQQCPRSEAVQLLRRTRGPDAARQGEELLPDPVDLHRDADLLTGLGLTVAQMLELMGSSP